MSTNPVEFPSNPTVGQLFTAPNGVDYIWNGMAWIGRVNQPTITHNSLLYRNDADAHPMSSITGLVETLAVLNGMLHP